MATPTVCVVAAALLLALARSAAAQDFAAERRRMVEDISALVRETRAEIGKGKIRAFDERVMTVMARVPRHEFVPADQVRFKKRCNTVLQNSTFYNSILNTVKYLVLHYQLQPLRTLQMTTLFSTSFLQVQINAS